MRYILFSEKLNKGIFMSFGWGKFELTEDVRIMTTFDARAKAQRVLDEMNARLYQFKSVLPISDDFNPQDFAVKEIE